MRIRKETEEEAAPAPSRTESAVNVVDLMQLYQPLLHPHGMDEATFIEQFTEDKPVVFAFHGCPRAIHEIIHGRPNTPRFHVRGFIEEGTTTPFDMVVLNGMSRYHLCIEAMRRAIRVHALTPALIAECNDLIAQPRAYVRANLEDMPEVCEGVWTDYRSYPAPELVYPCSQWGWTATGRPVYPHCLW